MPCQCLGTVYIFLRHQETNRTDKFSAVRFPTCFGQQTCSHKHLPSRGGVRHVTTSYGGVEFPSRRLPTRAPAPPLDSFYCGAALNGRTVDRLGQPGGQI
ncbi:hypothetical protein ZHAS_00008746 [Anopheles sinensis]|uniref:Uncharacterized protein n=1 Tax=Anopheles sinensis TaxID=74873 RepID=A0A084VT90_ANOSI|nr:hypothetical protein ZHAS_00008746 [Anopheles sinensis]